MSGASAGVWSAAEALRWCHVHNAAVRFYSNKTVGVTVNGVRRRRASFVAAANAVALALETPGRSAP